MVLKTFDDGSEITATQTAAALGIALVACAVGAAVMEGWHTWSWNRYSRKLKNAKETLDNMNV